MQCIITEKQPNNGKLANCDETKKMALNTHTVRARDPPYLNHGGHSLRQKLGTDPPIKDLS